MTECPAHPGVEAVGTCSRCGRFYCAAEARVIDGQRYCGTCAERPEVDWLGRHYAQLEGKRSGLVWFASFLGALLLFLAGGMLVVLFDLVRDVLHESKPLSDLRWATSPLGVMLWAVSALLLQTGKRWALTLNLVMVPVTALMTAFPNPDLEGQLIVGGIALLLTGMFWAVLRSDVRTRLFFRIPVERGALRQHYERYGSNWQATSASRLAVLSLFVPPLAPVSLGLAVWGLARVDKRAVPPVGGLGSAVGGALLSAFTCAFLGFIIFNIISH